MEYRRLGNSGLRVSAIGLGTNAFGSRADEATSIRIINQALELGVNFIDTAESYTQGHSEEIIGKALKGKRAQAVIATKFGHFRTAGPKERGGSRSYIIKAVENSLKRLDTDYIDLYYLHTPDTETPVEETLRALEDLIRAGKVRYIACSNFAAWQLCEAAWTARVNHLPAFIAAQSRYNLLDRSIEQEIAPCCSSYGLSIVPWGPLASGFLTGKYERSEQTPGRFAPGPGIYGDVYTQANFDKLSKLEAFAKEHGHGMGELAVAWLLSHPWLGSVITGATKPEQVASNASAGDWRLTAAEAAEVNKIA